MKLLFNYLFRTVLFISILTLPAKSALSEVKPNGSAIDTTHLSAPMSITADPGRERATISWSPVKNSTSFTIYYGTTPGVTKTNFLNRIENQHSPYIERNLTNGKLYYFRVAATDGKDEGPLTKEVSAIPSATPPPAAPTNVTAAPGPGWIRLSWLPSAGAKSYNIYYDKSPNVSIASVFKIAGAKSPRYVAPLIDGMRYFLIVTAVSDSGESAVSFETSAVPAVAAPPTPEDLHVSEGNGQVSLDWKSVKEAVSYSIYYANEMAVSKQTGTKVSVTNGNKGVVTGLTNNKPYFFVITSVNESGESSESNWVSATPVAVKPYPTMVPIPAGSFQMGDNLDGTLYCLPVKTVEVDAFYIDRYEVMYTLWKEVYDWAVGHGYAFDNKGLNGSFGNGTNLPVTTISWYDSVKWLNARSEKEGRTPVYHTDATKKTVYRTGQVNVPIAAVHWDADGFRLPTEAEWEKAARAGLVGKRYPWGNELTPGLANDNMGAAVSVGSYNSNAYGLYDMAGNIFEWVWDWGTEGKGYDWAAVGPLNPRGPDSSAEGTRVRRGGGYTYGTRYLSCYERMFRVPTYTSAYFGFRCASNKP